MRSILLTRGAPASSKSTFIKNNNLEPYTLSADSIRLLIQSPILFPDGSIGISQKNDRRVWELLMQLVEERMDHQEFIVVDATHSKSSDFAKYKKLAEIYRYRIFCVDFSDVSLETCLRQNRQRESYKFVPEEVIKNLHTRIQTQAVPNYVKVVKPAEINCILEYKPLDFNKYNRIRILGDIHSSYQPVKEYFEKYPLLETDYLISVGDLFDRNDQSAEIMQWWLTMFDRPNVCLLQSNHGVHFNNWAFGLPIKSDVFKYETLVQLQKAGFTDKEARSIARKEAQFAYFSFNNNTYFVNHGGIPCLPEKLVLLSGQSLIKGIGKYEEVDRVCDSWNMLTGDNVYQIFGHRSTGENMAVQRGRVFRLESKIEFGGFLTALHITNDGHEIIQTKNNHFCAKPSVNQIKVPKTNQELIEALRGSKDVYECKMNNNISSFSFKREVFYSKQWSDLSQIARGLFINNITNEIVARSWRKFFNVGERNETKPEILKDSLNFPVACFLKENGFLALLGYDSLSDSLVFTSKSRVDGDFAKNFKRIFMSKFDLNKLDKLKQFLKNENLSLAFEVIDPVNDPHIIEYKEEKVICLGAFYRQVEEKEVPYEKLQTICDDFGLAAKDRIVVCYNWDELKSRIELQDAKISDQKAVKIKIEGWVLEDAKGFKVKIKTPYYRHVKACRGIQQVLANGKRVNESGLTYPEINVFYAWAKNQDRDYLKNNSVIEVYKKFEKENTEKYE